VTDDADSDLFSLESLVPKEPPPTKGVYRKPDPQGLKASFLYTFFTPTNPAHCCCSLSTNLISPSQNCISDFVKQSLKPDDLTVGGKINFSSCVAFKTGLVQKLQGLTLQKPDAKKTLDILKHLRDTYGDLVVGKSGYSKAYIDGMVYRVFGEMEAPSLIVPGLWLGSEYNAGVSFLFF